MSQQAPQHRSRDRVASTPTSRRIVELACRASSVLNTQPWSWRATADRIDLYADHSRRLATSDPHGRNLVISCGVALHHVQVVAAALGLGAAVTRWPDPSSERHLATLALTPTEPVPDAAADLQAIALRSTDRQRFTDWPIPDERLARAATSITQADVHGVALTEVADRFRMELLVNRALTRQGPDDPSRSALDPRVGGEDVRIGSDGLIVLATETDDPAAWLRTGEGLSALWLHATTDGLSVVPLSQVIDVEETRQALRFEVLGGAVFPQLLVRIGWQEIGVSQRPRTPRRPVDDVLLP